MKLSLGGAKHRLFISLAGIIIIVLKWRWAVQHLYSLPKHALAAFSSLNTNSDYVIGAIVIWMVTGKLIYDWKNRTASVVSEAHEIATYVEKKMRPKDFDDDQIP